MSILSTDLDISFPTKPREVHPYRLYDNYILTITETFDYQVITALSSGNNVLSSAKPWAVGKFPEDAKEAYYILGPESFFFDIVNKSEIIYYSPTDKNLKIFNLKTSQVTRKIDCTLELTKENSSFVSLVYYPESSKVRILSVKDENTVILREINSEGGVSTIQEVAMRNPNCIARNEGRCFYSSQILYKEPFRICFFSESETGVINFDIKERDITPLDFGFFNEKTVLVPYNSNETTGNGMFILNLNDYNFEGEFTINPEDSDKCSNVDLALPDGEIECYDGRMIIDKIVRSLSLFGYVSPSF